MTDWIGKQISHYRVLKQLGQGGMGIVYLAEDINIGRQVVLKLLKADLVSDARVEERFRREARACASVNHPNISIIYEVDRHEEMWFICMEFVEGLTLRAMLREQTVLPLAEAVRVAACAADALGAAHERGIVHRDMKPENIMLAASGQVKVLDFGLAVFTGGVLGALDIGQMETGVERLTTEGVAIGTLHYMSPEQTRGQPVRPSSDVFSLGAVLYEAICGVPPFRGENSLSVMHAITYDQPPPVSSRRADAPQELDLVIRRALRKDPSQRYESGHAMRDDLHKVMAVLAAATSPLPETPTPSISAPTAQRHAVRIAARGPRS